MYHHEQLKRAPKLSKSAEDAARLSENFRIGIYKKICKNWSDEKWLIDRIAKSIKKEIKKIKY